MIQAPRFVQFDLQRREQLLHIPGKFWVARSRILDLIHLSWKAAKIVDCSWGRRFGDCKSRNKPVSRDRQDCSRFWQVPPYTSPAFGVPVVAQGVQRIAVSEEYRGHPIRHFELFLFVGCLGETRSMSQVDVCTGSTRSAPEVGGSPRNSTQTLLIHG